MAGQYETPPPDIASVIDAAIGGGDPNTLIGPPAPEQPMYGMRNTGALAQSNAILSLLLSTKGPPTKTDNISKQTINNPLSGMPEPNPYPTYRYWWSDGSYVDVAGDPQGGHVVGGPALKDLNPATSKPPTAETRMFNDGSLRQEDTSVPLGSPDRWKVISPPVTPEPKVYGTGANDPNIYTVDPRTGQATIGSKNPSYRDPTQQPMTSYEEATAQTARGNLLDSQSRTALLASQQYFEDQVAAGKMSDDQAAQQFKQVFDIFTANRDIATTAQQAGRDAVAAAQASNANRVGPDFGANFARGLQGVRSGNPSMVNYGPNDFTYPTPDYPGIAAKAQAAVTARLSQYAGALSQQNAAYRPAAIPTYGAPALPATYQPPPIPVLTQAANAATGSGAAAPPPLAYQPPRPY